jgi:hypothetical protein
VEAQRHGEKAQLHYDMGRFDAAVSEYEEAYEIGQDSFFLYKMADACRRGGDAQRAIDLYQNYLDKVPQTPFRAEIEERIRAQKKHVDVDKAGGKAAAQPEHQPRPSTVRPQVQPLPPPPPSPPPRSLTASTGSKLDVVTLTDHQRLEGTVLKQEPGQWVLIQTTDGIQHNVPWKTIVQMVVAPQTSHNLAAESRDGPDVGSKPTVNATPKVVTPSMRRGSPSQGTRQKTSGSINSEGVSLARSVDCTGSDAPECHKEMKATIGAEGPQASYVSESDCAEGDQGERCHQRFEATSGRAGLSASYTKETTTEVAKPPSHVTSLAVDVGGGGLFGNGSGMYFLQTILKLEILAGGEFPGVGGGHWNGVLIEPQISSLIYFSHGTSVSLQTGATFGWEHISFSAQDSDSLKQPGVAFSLGLFVGASGEKTHGSDSGSGTRWSAAYGPAIGVGFPSYNPGTASYSSTTITLMVLPTSGKSIFGSILLGCVL